MKFVTGVVLCSSVLGAVWAQIGNGVDLSSPRASIESFVNAYNQHNTESMRKCVLNPTSSIKTDQFFIKNRMKIQFRASDYSDMTILNETASLVVNLELSAEGAAHSQKELVLMRRLNSEWKIDSDATVRLAFDPKTTDSKIPKYMLGAMATLASGNERLLASVESRIDRDEEEICLRQMKILSLCAGMYELDHDQLLPPFGTWFNAIKPYLKTPTIPRCPNDSTEDLSYSMNKALDKQPLALLDDPKTTVLFYEGKNGVLNFRHQGKAAICFADPESPCKLVSPAESKKLNWKVFKSYSSISATKQTVVSSTTNPQVDNKKVNQLEYDIILLSAKVKLQANTISIQAIEIQLLKAQLAKKKSVSVIPPARSLRPEVGSTAAWRSLSIGMSKAQVKRLLGDPDRVSIILGSYQWEYSGFANVQFDRDGNLHEWSEPHKSFVPTPIKLDLSFPSFIKP